jgi:hypothetical protein
MDRIQTKEGTMKEDEFEISNLKSEISKQQHFQHPSFLLYRLSFILFILPLFIL